MLVLVYLYLKKLMNHSQKYSEFLGLISIYELLWACQFEGRWARWPRKRIKNARPPDYHASLSRGVTIQGPKLLHEVSKQLGQIRGLAFKLGIWPSAPLPILSWKHRCHRKRSYGHVWTFECHQVADHKFVFYLCLCI